MESGSDDSEHVCPLCMEEMDLTDRRFQPCQCGYQICLWCWHQIMELAGKNNTEGRCPACRTPYDKEKIVSAAPDPEELNEIGNEKKQKAQKLKPRATDGRKHLSNVRVVQRNLVYVVGLPLNIADDEILERREYFGQYGKIMKTAVSRASAHNSPHSGNGPTASVYVTFVKEEDALKCIQAVDGCMLEGKQLRACFGTTKYCNAWLKNVTCNNPDCLYLHEIGTQEDSFTKEEMLANMCSKHQTFHDLTHPPAKRNGPGLPPPPEATVLSVSHVPAMPSHAQQPTPLQASVQLGLSAKATAPVTAPRTSGLPPASSWGSKAGASKVTAQMKVPIVPATKLRSTGVASPSPSPGGSVVTGTTTSNGMALAPNSATPGLYRPSAAVLSGRVIQASAHPPPIVSALSLSTSPGSSSPMSSMGRQTNGVIASPNSTTGRHLSDGAAPVSVAPGSSPPIRQGFVDSSMKQSSSLAAQQQVKIRTRQVVVAHGIPQGLLTVNVGSPTLTNNETPSSTGGILSAGSSQSIQTSASMAWPDLPNSVSLSTSSGLDEESSNLSKISPATDNLVSRPEVEEGNGSGNAPVSDTVTVTKTTKPSSFAAVASAGAARSAAAAAIRGLHVSNNVQLRTIAEKSELRAGVRSSKFVTLPSSTGEEKGKEFFRSGESTSDDQEEQQVASQKSTGEPLDGLEIADDLGREAFNSVKDDDIDCPEVSGTNSGEVIVRADRSLQDSLSVIQSDDGNSFVDGQVVAPATELDGLLGAPEIDYGGNDGIVDMQATESEHAASLTVCKYIHKNDVNEEPSTQLFTEDNVDRHRLEKHGVFRFNDTKFVGTSVKPLNGPEGGGGVGGTLTVEETEYSSDPSQWQHADSGHAGGVHKLDERELTSTTSTPVVKEKDDSTVIADILGLDFDIWSDGPFGAPGDLAKLLFSGVGTDRVKAVSSQQVGQNPNTSRTSVPAKQSRFQFARLQDDFEEKAEKVAEKSLFSSKYPFEGTSKNGYHARMMDACADGVGEPQTLSVGNLNLEVSAYFSKSEEQKTGLVLQKPLGLQSVPEAANATPAPTLKSAASCGLTAPPGFSAPLLAPAIPATSLSNMPSGFSAPPGFSKPQGAPPLLGAEIPSSSLLASVQETPATITSTTSSSILDVVDSSLEDLEFVDPAIMAVGRGFPETRPAGPPSALQNPAIGWLFEQRPSSLSGAPNVNSNVGPGGSFPPGMLYPPQSTAHHLPPPPQNYSVPLAGRSYPPSPYAPAGFSTFPGPFARISPQLDPMFPNRPLFAQNSPGQLLGSQLTSQPGNHLYGAQGGVVQSGAVGVNQNSNGHVNAIPGLQFLRNFQPGPFQSRSLMPGVSDPHVGSLSLSSGFPSLPIGGQTSTPFGIESYAGNVELAPSAISAQQVGQQGQGGPNSQMSSSTSNSSLSIEPSDWSGVGVHKVTNWVAVQDSHGNIPDTNASFQEPSRVGHGRTKSEETVFSAPTSRVTSPLLNRAPRASTPEVGVAEGAKIVKPPGFAKRVLWDNDSPSLTDGRRGDGLSSRIQEAQGSQVPSEGGGHEHQSGHGSDRSPQKGDRDSLEVGEQLQNGDSRHIPFRAKKEQKRKSLKVRRERETVEKVQSLSARSGKGKDGKTTEDAGCSIGKADVGHERSNELESKKEVQEKIHGLEGKKAKDERETKAKHLAQDVKEKAKRSKRLLCGQAAHEVERTEPGIRSNESAVVSSPDVTQMLEKQSDDSVGSNVEKAIAVNTRPSMPSKAAPSVSAVDKQSVLNGGEEGMAVMNSSSVPALEQSKVIVSKPAGGSGTDTKVQATDGKMEANKNPEGAIKSAKSLSSQTSKKGSVSALGEQSAFDGKSSEVSWRGKEELISSRVEKVKQDKLVCTSEIGQSINISGNPLSEVGKSSQEEVGLAAGLSLSLLLQQRLEEELQMRTEESKDHKGSNDKLSPTGAVRAVGHVFQIATDLNLDKTSLLEGLPGWGQVESLEREVENAREVERALESRLMEVKEWIDKDNALLEGIAANAPTNNFLYSPKVSFCTCGRDTPCEKQ